MPMLPFLTVDLYGNTASSSAARATTSAAKSSSSLAGTTQSGLDATIASLTSTALTIGIVLVFIVLVGLCVWALMVAIRHLFFSKKILTDWKKRVFLEVSVPKETADDSQKEHGNRGDEKEQISVGEQMYLVLSEYAKKGIKGWLFGTERFSFEILTVDQKIKFFVVCSTNTVDSIQRQIISTYSRADIKRHKNYLFFKPDAVTHVQEIELAQNFALPFRTYRQMEKDPLNALSNALSALGKEESAAIQIVMEPIFNKKWQKRSRQIALKIQQGQSVDAVFHKYGMGDGNKVLRAIGGGMGSLGKGVGDVMGSVFKQQKDEKTQGEHERNIDLTGTKQAIQLTPQQQEIIKKLEEKASRPGFRVVIRVVAAAKTAVRAEQIVSTILPVFQIYDIRPFNGLKKKPVSQKKAVYAFATRAGTLSKKMILNTEELNSLWHIPGYHVQNPFIDWLPAKRPSIPLGLVAPGEDTVFIGKAKSGMQEQDVYMKREDRFRHLYTLGGSGSGKSVFLTNMILQDIAAGNGVCVVDPHGETVDDVLLRMPKERRDDVIIFSPAFTDRPMGLNMLEYDRLKPTQRTIVIDTLFSIWDKLYDLKTTGGPMFESYMKNAMRLVMSHEPSGSTLMEISKVLSDEEYRTFKLAMCDDQQVVDFWEKEAQKAGGDASLENMVPYITSKLSPFVNNDFIRPMIGQQKSAINFREAMDNKKIILLKLEKGMIGETSAYLVGMVVIGNLLMAGMGRNDGLKYNLDGTTTPILATERPPFFVYIDEMQNFLFDAIPKALEEIRKYKVGFVLAHQFVKQVIKNGDERIKDSIMANCASKFIFRTGAEDAELLAKEFAPTLTPFDLQNPERFTCNAIVLADGQRTTPFNIAPPPLSPNIDVAFKQELIDLTKAKYGRTLEEVEKDIKERVEKFLF
jgi:hypothetical protein